MASYKALGSIFVLTSCCLLVHHIGAQYVELPCSYSGSGMLPGYVKSTYQFRVCARVWPPFVIKNAKTGALSGYEIDLWSALSTWMGGLSYTITAVNANDDALRSMLLTPPSSSGGYCDVVIGNWRASSSDIALGIQNSVDIFRGGYQVAIANPNTQTGPNGGIWFFVVVFDKWLWLTLFLAAVGITPFIYFSELDYRRRGLGKSRFPSSLAPGLIEAFYRTYGKVYNVVDEMRVRALSSKAIALAWGTSCTILLSAYTAGLVAAATSANFVASGVTGPYSLVNTMVGTYAGDTHAFLRYGWIGTPVDSYSYSGSWSLYNQLMNTSSGITSVVMDTAWLNSESVMQTCNALVIGKVFQYRHNVFAYNANLDPGFIYNTTVALSDLAVTQDYYTNITAKYMPGQSCMVASSNSAQLTLKEMEGMWIVVSVLVGIALTMVALTKINKNWDIDALYILGNTKSGSGNSSIRDPGGGGSDRSGSGDPRRTASDDE